jgi:hypothetical protein
MAQIKLKNSVTAGSIPAGLSFGEVAVNITDKKIFVGNAVESTVTIYDPNNHVLSFNGSTGAVTFNNYVSSVNGATGAVTNVARTNEGNTFSVRQAMSAGISSANLNVSGGATFTTIFSSSTTDCVDILASTNGIGLRVAQNVGGGAAAVGGIRLGRSSTTALNYLLYASAGTFYVINGTGGTDPQLMTLNSVDANFNVPIRGATFSSSAGRITVQKSIYSGSDSGTIRIVGADAANLNVYSSDIRANTDAAADTTHTLPASSGTLLNTSSTINATTSTITSSNVNATRYLAFVGGTGNTGIFIDDVTTPLTYNPQGGNIGAKKVTLTTSANVLTLDSASPNVTLTDGSNVAIFGLDSFAANYTSGRFTISNDGDGLDINALNGITLDPGSGVVEVASAVVSDGGYRITSNAINAQTDSYSLQESDNGKIITVNAGSVKTITVPSGLSIGFNCTIMRIGAGRVTFSASGTTINSIDGLLEIASQHGAASLLCYASDTFNLSGNLA